MRTLITVFRYFLKFRRFFTSSFFISVQIPYIPTSYKFITKNNVFIKIALEAVTQSNAKKATQSANRNYFQITCVIFTQTLKSCVHYIFATFFLGLNENACQIKKKFFYFSSKGLFVLEKIKF